MTGAILVGGGMGRRLGSAVPKAFVRLGGRTLARRCLERFSASPEVAEIVLVVPAARAAACRRLLREYPKLRAVVAGGALRQDSVRCGLAALDRRCRIVLVHDAARPCASRDLIRRVAAAARRYGAAVPALPARETMKTAAGPWVGETIDRCRIVAVQTPQGCRRDWLEAALERARAEGFEGSDDAVLLERAGRRVRIVPGEASNIKITWPADVAAARACLRAAGER